MTNVLMRVLVTRRLPDPVLERLGGRVDFTLRDNTTPMTAPDCAQAMAEYDIILPTLGDDFSAAAFAAGEVRCRLLANFGVGYNHIDINAAHGAGIQVTNTPGAVTEATADIALALMLAACRRTGEGERLVRSGGWTGWHPTQMLGTHMSGKRVGIVGMGRIGQAIARRCRLGFGMRVAYFNRTAKTVEGCHQVPTLADLAGCSDFLIAAVPGGPSTRHLINSAVFKAMPKHGFFINIARGDVVDETALVAALVNGDIAGAGLDVYEREPVVSPELLAMDTVTLLPHLGTATDEVRTDMGMMAVENIFAFMDAREPPNLV